MLKSLPGYETRSLVCLIYLVEADKSVESVNDLANGIVFRGGGRLDSEDHFGSMWAWDSPTVPSSLTVMGVPTSYPTLLFFPHRCITNTPHFTAAGEPATPDWEWA